MLKNYIKLIVAILFVSNVMAQNIPSYVPKDGLVGWWPFNGNANDESGNGNHGTVNGATLTTDRNGVANSAYSFDGISNTIKIKDNNILDLEDNLSISSWFMGSEFTVVNMILAKHNVELGNNLGTYAYGIWNHNNNYLVNFQASPQFTTATYHDPQFKISSNKWYNFIISYDDNSKNLKYYLNGNLIFNKYINFDILNTDNDLIIGANNSNNNFLNYFKGIIDDIAIYNRALSEQEVKQLYEGCTKETATSSSFNSYIFTNNAPINLSATPTGGVFSGEAVTNNTFEPSKAKLGKNQVTYNFKNSTGCDDSTNFTMILVDTLGNKCSTYDKLKIKVQLTTGIKAGQLTSMNVYPNPASELLIIEANDIQALSRYKYKILDLQGKEVYNSFATSAKTEISLKSIGAKGMYILHIVDEKGVSIENKKIVLE